MNTTHKILLQAIQDLGNSATFGNVHHHVYKATGETLGLHSVDIMLRIMKDAGELYVTQVGTGNYPSTWYKLTDIGRKALETTK